MVHPSHVACFVLCLSAASAWNDCAFPQVDWFALDEGVGISYAYAVAAMNGNMYSGGYTKGNFAFVGVTDGADINPNPSASLWGDTTSNVQNLYVAEVDPSGSMTKGWHFKGSAIQIGQIGHGIQTNSIDAHSGMHAMLDKMHIAVKGGFRQLLELPDGTLWSSASRINDRDQVPFVMSIDVSSTQGIGTGTTGWAKLMDDDHAGGASVSSVDGDADGNMIVAYEGCASFNASATSVDSWGRTVQGAKEDCTNYVTKLAAAGGTTVWRHEIPTQLSSCRTITGGSFFCGWSMSASMGTLDFGNGITVESDSEDSRVGIVKYNSNGIAQWARATVNASLGDLAVSNTGTLLAVTGYSSTLGAVIWRIDTSSGNEGNVLWSEPGAVGTHGFRGVEVTDDDMEVVAFGQVTGTETITDSQGSTMTLRSRGSYEVFVVAYDATDGTGKWAMDGGGTGMEYFFAMASDPDTHEVYIGGTSRSEYITWGDVKRKNVMYNGQPGLNNPDTTSPVGSSKAFVVKLKSTLVVPECLATCNSAYPLQASDVKSGHCYIDRHCYADGDSSPYTGFECRRCDAAVDPLQWSSPDTSDACFIDGACVASGAHAQVRSGWSYVDDPCLQCDPSKSEFDYSPVAGCELPSLFQPGCYERSGSWVMSLEDMMDDKQEDKDTIASLTTSNAQLTSEVASLSQQKTVLQTQLDTLENLEQPAPTASCEGMSEELAIAIIVIMSVMFLISFCTLGILIHKERVGKPMFVKFLDTEPANPGGTMIGASV